MSLKKLGRYDLVRVLGKGAMGLVYEGRDPNLDRRVAIKTIKVENLSDEAAADYEVRFRTEARSAARLQHPNIVSVYDSDRDGDIAFLVMEFVEGDDLKHHLDKGSAYTLEQTMSIMRDLLSALEYAHQQKVVHRDIKPANLLVQASGRIKLADFGVARIQDSGDMTRTQGSIVGTLKYMSPEQLEGRPIDARADLFAAGVVLYQLLTSQRPFDGDTDFAVIQKIVTHTPEAATFYNPKLPPAIDAVVAKSLAKSRDLRYATAQEFAAALQKACKEAADITIAPVGKVPAKGSNSTWTATMMAGESLVATESGVGTSSGTSNGTSVGTGASLVTQEIELVYYKEIKDSSDIEDLQGFLSKFPNGTYADLARKRLKNLGAETVKNTGKVSGEDTDVSDASRARPASSSSMDKTWVMSRPNAANPQAAADPDGDVTLLIPAPAPVSGSELAPAPASVPEVSPEQPQSKSSGKLAVLAGVAALAIFGVVFKLLSGPGSTPLAAQVPSPELAASAPAAAASSVAGSVASSAASSAPLVSTSPAGSASAPLLGASAPASASATVTEPAAAAGRPLASAPSKPQAAAQAVLRPANAASKPLAVVKKIAPEKEKATKPNVGKTTESAASAATPATPAPATNNPRAACEDRILLGFQTCLSEQCTKPAFANHPTCVERRAMDERRREAERNR